MKRKTVDTADGSSTIYVSDLGEHYHSIHGAEQESLHIYVRLAMEEIQADEISILEFGFGTGLNAILTLAEAAMAGRKINYHTVEKYPLSKDEVSSLNFDVLHTDANMAAFRSMHVAPWGEWSIVTEQFRFRKELVDFRLFEPRGPYHITYFDAFSPDVQPRLWTKELFSRIYKSTLKNGLLTTYSSKGLVRRRLEDAGFRVAKFPGPPGKREFLVARKSDD